MKNTMPVCQSGSQYPRLHPSNGAHGHVGGAVHEVADSPLSQCLVLRDLTCALTANKHVCLPRR